ncbi:WecB/TagA/CpsF family glycosyltransferase [Cerasicoccus maritimus]|uniref:WecB/TagA/CpsF family glycosyltransferase n=1 Tax=Cerasicoccus maritimus TaxID=490089 RepID=UPI0028529ECB|nr:WecB/TagA/CpsF family glycosyltransferase [Cerasicoccus maritimus]
MDIMPAYSRAVQSADLAVVDSGFLVLCWKFFRKKKLSRLSGLLLLETILANVEPLRDMEQVWVMPTAESAERTRTYLNACGIKLSLKNFYIAPHYDSGALEDIALRDKVSAMRPALIMVNVAGGKQEVLGHWLLQQLDYRPAVICTGAAIAFKTGEQANIPTWGDRLFLGWFLRILSDPKRYFGRYWRAIRLWRHVRKYGERAPVIQA